VKEDMKNPLDFLGQKHFEEEFYLGNSDKLLYTMKEFHIEMHKDNITKTSDSLACSNLDIQVSSKQEMKSNHAALYIVCLELQLP
jgi:hypothetical protein